MDKIESSLLTDEEIFEWMKQNPLRTQLETGIWARDLTASIKDTEIEALIEALKTIVAEGTRCAEETHWPVREMYNINEVDRIAREALKANNKEKADEPRC